MGLSSNQARFLSLTARQVDMEQRIQQICQRRLRLSSELENVATSYNNSISNRKMSTASQTNNGIDQLSSSNLKKLGYRVINSESKALANAPIKAINQLSESAAIAAGYTTIHNVQELQSLVNSNPSGKFILEGDVDLSSLGTLSTSLISGNFSGTFNGNGYVISNLSINTSATGAPVGLFSQNSGSIQNVSIENANVNSANQELVGLLAGENTASGTISNSYSTGTVSGLQRTGGLVGRNMGDISDSYSTADVNGLPSGIMSIGGLVGVNWNTIERSYATGNVNAPGMTYVGGFVGGNNGAISDCYATGSASGDNQVGGLVGSNGPGAGNSTIKNSYSTASVYASSGSGAGSITGLNCNSSDTDDSTNFYTTVALGDAGGATTNQASATSAWNTSTVWDMSSGLPTFITTGGLSSSRLEEGLRNGTYSLAREADEYSQDTFDINGDQYQEVDWRTAPAIYDELNHGDDVDAENKYDKTIDEINSQDKKLQLEQTSIEVEYKAVTSEKESVKKILDTNAASSFKYFS